MVNSSMRIPDSERPTAEVNNHAAQEIFRQRHPMWNHKIPPKPAIVDSPRFLTINVPTMAPSAVKTHHSFYPPQEIVIETPPGEVHPPTIDVKGNFCPPKEINVLVLQPKENRRVPDVIGIAPAKQAATQAKPEVKRKRNEQEWRKSDVPPDAAAHRPELPVLGAEITVIRPHPHRRSATDPPAAMADTSSRQILPDFSHLAGSPPNQRGRRKNILDETRGNHPPYHQSWPATLKHSNETRPQLHPWPNATRAQVPPWLGVTGTPEDWIQPDGIRQIGRKIGPQRFEI